MKHRIPLVKLLAFGKHAAKIVADLAGFSDGASPEEIAALIAAVEALVAAVRAARDEHPVEG